MHEVLVNRLGGLSLSRKSVVRLADRPDMTLDVYRGRNATTTMNHVEESISTVRGSWWLFYDFYCILHVAVTINKQC